MGLRVILVIIAIILFALAALSVSLPVVEVGWLGLAFFAASFIVRE